jgi:hypothetical protein
MRSRRCVAMQLHLVGDTAAVARRQRSFWPSHPRKLALNWSQLLLMDWLLAFTFAVKPGAMTRNAAHQPVAKGALFGASSSNISRRRATNTLPRFISSELGL